MLMNEDLIHERALNKYLDETFGDGKKEEPDVDRRVKEKKEALDTEQEAW